MRTCQEEQLSFLSRQHFGFLKGMAIIAVLVCHVGNFSGVTWFTPLGGVGVAIFLFCSGYGLRCSYASVGLKRYWLKKIIGVYSIYFLTELAMAVILVRNPRIIVLDLLLIEPLHPFGWYMQYLFGCYFVFWLVFKIQIPNKWRLISLTLLAGLSFFLLGGLQGEQALSFLGGVFMATYGEKRECRMKNGKLAAGILLIVSVALLAVKQLPVIREQQTEILTLFDLCIKSFAAASIIYLTYAMKFVYTVGKAVFGFFGKISYELYLVHGYWMFVLSKNLFGNYFINALVVVVVSIGTAYLVNFVTTKMINGVQKRVFAER